MKIKKISLFNILLLISKNNSFSENEYTLTTTSDVSYSQTQIKPTQNFFVSHNEKNILENPDIPAEITFAETTIENDPNSIVTLNTDPRNEVVDTLTREIEEKILKVNETNKNNLIKKKEELVMQAQNLKNNINALNLEMNLYNEKEMAYKQYCQELELIEINLLEKEIILLNKTIEEKTKEYETQKNNFKGKISLSELENKIEEISNTITQKTTKLNDIEKIAS
jgi:hypothetical protein